MQLSISVMYHREKTRQILFFENRNDLYNGMATEVVSWYWWYPTTIWVHVIYDYYPKWFLNALFYVWILLMNMHYVINVKMKLGSV